MTSHGSCVARIEFPAHDYMAHPPHYDCDVSLNDCWVSLGKKDFGEVKDFERLKVLKG